MPAPPWFKPAHEVEYAAFDPLGPGFGPRKGLTARRAAGLRYERRALLHLEARNPGRFVWGPWLRFRSRGKLRWCQPDALLIDPLDGRVIAIEVKHHHTSDAWWQLEALYRPVLQRIFPAPLWRVDSLEVVRWFDAAVHFPCTPVLIDDPWKLPRGKFGVHIIGRRDLNAPRGERLSPLDES